MYQGVFGYSKFSSVVTAMLVDWAYIVSTHAAASFSHKLSRSRINNLVK